MRPVPVSIRTSRFLERDGSTHFTLTWGLRETATDNGVVQALGVQFSPSYERETVRRQTLDASSDSIGAFGYTLSMPGSKRPFNAAFEWIQTDASGEELQVYGHTVQRYSSVDPLDASGTTLEMSDLQVRVLPDSTVPPVDWQKKSRPYAFQALPSITPLLFYFELYHLTFDANDKVRYSVEYVVEQKEEQSRWRRLFTRADVESVSAESEYTGSSRRTDQSLQSIFQIENSVLGMRPRFGSSFELPIR